MEIPHPSRLLLAAARLLPANASATVRLDALRASPGTVEPLYGRRGWVDRAVEAVCPGASAEEDRPPHPFTDEVVGPYGASVVLPGPVQDAVYANRLLLAALYLDRRRLRGRRTERLAARVAAVLAVAGATSDRAGLGPYLAPERTRRIVLPRHADRSRLEAAISWAADELRLIDGANDAMGWLATGSRRVATETPDGWLIEAPELLLVQVNELIAAEFVERDAVDDLLARYGRALGDAVRESVARMGARSAHRLRRSAGVEAFTMGDDSRLLLAVLNDPLAPPWDSEDGLRPIDGAVAEALAAAGPHDVALAVGQPLAAPYFAQPGGGAGPFALGMAASDLDVLSRWADRTPLGLLRFARSAAAARDRGDVVRFSTLDEFVLYLQLGERHPQPPSGSGFVLLVEPGTAEPLRRLVARETGMAAVHPPGYRGVAAGTKRYRTARLPVIVPPAAYDPSARIVAAGRLEVWFRPDGGDEAGVLADVVDSLATAFALLPADLPGCMPDVAGSMAVLVSDDRASSDAPLDEEGRPPILSGGIEKDGTAHLALEPGFAEVAGQADNEADRYLVEAVLRMVYDLAGDPRDAGEAVEAVLPIGRRRLIGMPAGDLADLLGPPDVRPWRPVSEAEVARWDDTLTEEALAPHVREAGPRALINAAVEHLVERMASGLVELDRDAALLRAVELVESAHREEALVHSRLVSAPLVFGEEDDEVLRLRRDLQRIPRSAVSARYLVECVAATPSTGGTPCSDRAAEELTALASLVTELGLASDRAWLGGGRVRAAFDTGGRLHVEVRPIQAQYAAAAERWQRGEASRAYDEWWHFAPDHEVQLDARSLELDAAWRGEFGYALSEVLLMMNGALLAADDRRVSVAVIDRAGLLDEIAERKGMARGLADRILSDLTLTPRARISEAPPGFRQEDVFPWRFNRAYSYVRRPFVAAGRPGDPQIAFGTRHLVHAGRHLFSLVGGGSLRARTSGLRTLMGAIAAERARALVEDVAGACRAAGMTARTGVRKAGGGRIGAPGPDLGDIDVLALDPRRRRVLAIECKSSAAARTPWELASESKEFIRPGGHLERHDRRVEWLRVNRGAVARDFDAELRGWEFVGLLVTDMPIPTAFGSPRRPIRIVDLAALRKELEADA